MKISKDYMSSQTIKQTPSTVEGKNSFHKMVQSQANQLKQQEIDQLLQQISIQGDKLARFRSLRDLARFKRLIKSFLNETVYDGLHLQKNHHFSFDGHSQQLSIVKAVDEKLIELTDELMNQEKKAVDLLAIIGEIKGLLVNLYT